MFHAAAGNGQIEVLKWLIEQGANSELIFCLLHLFHMERLLFSNLFINQFLLRIDQFFVIVFIAQMMYERDL